MGRAAGSARGLFADSCRSEWGASVSGASEAEPVAGGNDSPPLAAQPKAATAGGANCAGAVAEISARELSRRFVFTDLLGQGEFGRVWRCLDRRGGPTSEPLACKQILTAHLTADQRLALHREIAVLRRLQGHPNVLRLYAICDADGSLEGLRGSGSRTGPSASAAFGLESEPSPRRTGPDAEPIASEGGMRRWERDPPGLGVYLITELCSGGDLFDFIDRFDGSQNGRQHGRDGAACGLDERTAAGIFVQIARAVEWCHLHDVAHRDIKPENVLIAGGAPPQSPASVGAAKRSIFARNGICGQSPSYSGRCSPTSPVVSPFCPSPPRRPCSSHQQDDVEFPRSTSSDGSLTGGATSESSLSASTSSSSSLLDFPPHSPSSPISSSLSSSLSSSSSSCSSSTLHYPANATSLPSAPKSTAKSARPKSARPNSARPESAHRSSLSPTPNSSATDGGSGGSSGSSGGEAGPSGDAGRPGGAGFALPPRHPEGNAKLDSGFSCTEPADLDSKLPSNQSELPGEAVCPIRVPAAAGLESNASADPDSCRTAYKEGDVPGHTSSRTNVRLSAGSSTRTNIPIPRPRLIVPRAYSATEISTPTERRGSAALSPEGYGDEGVGDPTEWGFPNLLGAADEPEVRLADFGLACEVPPGSAIVGLAGSAPYEAPEMLEMKPYDHQADVWSLGILLHTLLSATWPEFPGGRRQLGRHDLTAAPWPSISRDAKDLIRRMLVVDPSKRLDIHCVLQHPWVVTWMRSKQRVVF